MKKYGFVLSLIFILGLSYWRYTYLLNPNLYGEPVLIQIRGLGQNIPASSLVNIKSIIIYWNLFFIGNIAFFVLLFGRTSEKVKTVVFFYLLITLASILLFGIDTLWIKSPAIFSLASILKNFLLSPMFTAMAYLVVEYMHWFGKPT